MRRRKRYCVQADRGSWITVSEHVNRKLAERKAERILTMFPRMLLRIKRLR